MAMLGHSFIPHHHHDLLAIEHLEDQVTHNPFYKNYKEHSAGCNPDKYQKSNVHRHENEINDKTHTHSTKYNHFHTHQPDNDHSFPIHSHISESGDFEFTRIVNGTAYKAPHNKVDFQIYTNQSRTGNDLTEAKIKYLHIDQVLNNSIFRYNAICLRAPPTYT